MWRSRTAAAAAAVVLLAAAAAAAAADEGEEATLDHDDMYCGSRSCYAVLGVSREATAREVKKAYRRLSLVLHPDKSREADATERFREVATAYEVLKDEESRAEYDYVLDHPEEAFRNRMRYYQFRYARKTNVWFVLSGALLLATIAHYLYWYSRFLYVRRQLRNHPEVKRRLQLRAQGLDADAPAPAAPVPTRGGRGGKKGARRRGPAPAVTPPPEPAAAAGAGAASSGDDAAKKEPVDDLEGIVEVTGWQGRAPTWRDLLVLWIPRAVWRVALYFYWLARWYVKFSLLGHEFGYEENEYRTGRILMERLRYPPMYWNNMSPEDRRKLVEEELWDEHNFKEYKRGLINKHKRTWR